MIKEIINQYFKDFDFDIRKSKDARYIDQKVTPDVLCIIADCVLNYVADRDIEFTKDDIWEDQYFIKNVKAIFNKPDAKNKNVRLEFDKFTSQPLKSLAYAQILSLKRKKGKNWYKIINKQILRYVALRERNTYNFLYIYLLKVLKDSDFLKYFEEFKNKCNSNIINRSYFQDLKSQYIKFILGNTKINTEIEINRIFPKVLNVYACKNFIQGTIKGHLSKRQIYFTDLMYNRVNWRDVNKTKHISRNEALLMQESLLPPKKSYSVYLVQKMKNEIRKRHIESELKDQWANGEATEVHHIFPSKLFPKLIAYPENLINLTPTQHKNKAHPNNKTKEINKDYQLDCLLAKSYSIEKSINKGEFFYRKESFIYVINTGLKVKLDQDLSFVDIRRELARIYNNI